MTVEVGLYPLPMALDRDMNLKVPFYCLSLLLFEASCLSEYF